jgi:hypothetical protein
VTCKQIHDIVVRHKMGEIRRFSKMRSLKILNQVECQKGDFIFDACSDRCSNILQTFKNLSLLKFELNLKNFIGHGQDNIIVILNFEPIIAVHYFCSLGLSQFSLYGQ